MSFVGSTPPYKKRRLMPQSSTDVSCTPSPPVTPRSNHNKKKYNAFTLPIINRMPHVDSTPIRNYFARFTDNNEQSRRQRRHKMHKTITPRALWKESDKIIPFPPSQFVPKQGKSNINIDSTKYDTFYHPLMDIIQNRKTLNIFPDSYFAQTTKRYCDKSPFSDPDLQIKMRDDLFQLLCDMKDTTNNKHNVHNNEDKDIDSAAAEVLQIYGDCAITNILQNVTDTKMNDIADTDMNRARQFIEYLRSNDDTDTDDNNDCSSYDDIKNGMVFLSGVLEFITANIVDSAGIIAQYNHSNRKRRMDDKEQELIRNNMDKYDVMLSQYDKDVFNHDIDTNGIIIAPLHIRHAIADDNELFWLQQSIQIKGEDGSIGNTNKNKDIEDALNNDCVYHICSFFCGDLPMLSSLARVNTTFYVMTSKNNLWKPIAIRCFLFNPAIVQQIEENYSEDNDDCYDLRGYISLSQHIKLIVLRERWIKQDIGGELFEAFVRINPVYDLNTKMYKLMYIEDDDDVDLYINHEIYELFAQLLEIFGLGNDDITIAQIINNVKCLNYNQIKQRFAHMFVYNTNHWDLNKMIEIEYNNNNHNDKEVLFVELPLSQTCFKNMNMEQDMDDDEKHYLWIGANIVIFATFPCDNAQRFQ